MTENSDLSLIRERIARAERVLLFTHIRPDGDSIGSCLALAHGLKALGKQVELVSEDPIPQYLSFLFDLWDGKNPFVTEPSGTHDCLILTDISSRDRAGKYLTAHPEMIIDICIDHHVSNEGLGELNHVEDKNPATCSILAGIFGELGMTIDQTIATELLTGMVTDTLGFSIPSVTPDVIRLEAKLMEYGAPMYDIVQRVIKLHAPAAVRCWKTCFTHLEFRGALAWSYLTKAERTEGNFLEEDDADFCNYMLNTEGVNISVVFVQQSENSVKMSWRAKPGFDVSKIAVSFGGGGHRAAAGATVSGTLEEVMNRVLPSTAAALNEEENQNA